MNEKDKLEAEIAKLSGAIQQRQSGPSSHSHHQQPRSHASTYSSVPSRGGPARGLSHPYKTFAPRRNMTLVINNKTNDGTGPSVGSGSNSGAATPVNGVIGGVKEGTSEGGKPSTVTKEATMLAGGGDRWVKSTSSKSGNRSLMNPDTYAKTQKARLARDSEKALIRSQRKQASRRRPPPVVQSYYSSGPQSSSSAAGLGQSLELKQRVVIDGVVFEFEEGGSKLKRMDEISTSPYATTPGARAESTTNANANATPTRHSLSMSGHQYLRTKNGNLIAAEKVRRRKSFGGSEGQSSSKNARGLKLVQKIDEPCRYFTKTGRCKKASTCPYKHDPNRLAICSKFLRNNCPYTADTCPISHTPSAHNTPSCQHFQKTGECRNGKDCIYPHVRVADDAPVCEPFAVEGWCEKGEKCTERHAWECREFNETGQCKRGTKCGLLHILRAKKGVDKAKSKGRGNGKQTEKGEDDSEDDSEEDDSEAEDEEDEEDEEDDDMKEGEAMKTDLAENGNEIEAQQDFIQFRVDDEDEDEDDAEEHDDEDINVSDVQTGDEDDSEDDESDAEMVIHD